MYLRFMKSRSFVLTLLLAATACGEDFSDELPRIPPTEPADTLANFTVADLVASEPLI